MSKYIVFKESRRPRTEALPIGVEWCRVTTYKDESAAFRLTDFLKRTEEGEATYIIKKLIKI